MGRCVWSKCPRIFKRHPALVAGRTRAVTCQASLKKSAHISNVKPHQKFNSFGLPKGLIGAKCTALVNIEGNPCSCLLDTGSQVTTVSQSFYEQNLPGLSITSLDNLLEIEAANGQAVPYLGYVEVRVTFPKDFLGSDVEVSTLALVIPETGGTAQPKALIGTNTLDLAYEKYLETNDTVCQAVPFGYRAVIKTIENRRQQKVNSSIGIVRLPNLTPTVVPAGQNVVLEGVVNVRGQVAEKWAVMEPPSFSPFPGGLLVASCLLNLPQHPSQKVPVVLKNETEHDIIIPGKSVIADIHALQKVISHKVTKPECSVSGVHAKSTGELCLDFGDSCVPEVWKKRITQKLHAMPEVFAFHDMDVGHTDKVRHSIKLQDETPFKHKARPIHPNDLEAVRRHLEELLEAGIIRESESSYSSPIVVVRKKNGDIRLCIDYRKLNMQTIKDAYALPNLEETFSALRGSKWFSVLDLKSGYYQIELEEKDKHKTAFVCPLGFWEFNRMPQGITNAPGTFQRLMEKCMGDINLSEVLVFLDDLIVFSGTLEEHERRLLHVLGRLKEYGLKLSLDKCKFFQTSVKYLGHIVSKDGVETDPQKIEAIKTWPSPQNLKELRSFLGFSGYYRRFIKDYAKLVKPLNELTVGYPPLRRGCKVKSNEKTYLDPKEPFGGRWTDDCQQAFKTLIDNLTRAPVLGFADPGLPYVLHTDASTTGLGAALYQEQDGVLRVIAYASRGLSRSEARYPAHKLEFLALKWAVTEKFCDYLYGSNFKVITDSNPLTYILTSAKLDATSYRWLSALSTFSFTLHYRPGRSNLDADALSRRPHGDLVNDATSQKEQDRIRQFTLYHSPEAANSTLVSADAIQAVCDRLLHHADASSCLALIESLSMCPEAVPEEYENIAGSAVVSCMSEQELREKQRNDPALREVIIQLESGNTVLPALRHELPELPFLLRELRKLELKDGVLYRKRALGECVTYQLALPPDLRAVAMESLHDNMGHMGIERTLDLIRSRFYWPRMASDVETKVKTCSRCVCRKSLPERAAPLVNIQVNRPLELVCMDFLSLEPDRSNTKDILVITDFFTKYADAVPTPNQKARTVAKSLWENFIVHYGMPEKLHSDQGPDFESKTIKELCEISGIKKVRTTPYHPRGNPVERFNRTLLGMLGTLKTQEKAHWKDFVRPLVHAYNCTKHETTGYTPYELMFGRQPRLPVDLIFNTSVNREGPKFHSQYVQSLKTHLQESYKLAQKNAAKTAERNKVRFDRRVTESTLEEGDRVLVRNVRLRGKHKLADRWDPVVHIVVSRAGELPVYTVRPERLEGPLRTLHRDLLLPCGFLSSLDDDDSDVVKPRKKRVTRQSRDAENEECLENYQSSDEDDYIPQISDVSALTSEKLIREYKVVRRPVELPLDSDTASQSLLDLEPLSTDASEIVNAKDVPRRKDPPEAEHLSHTKNSPDTQHLPEAESSSGDMEPVKEPLKERNPLPQVEQQSQDGPGGNKKEKDSKTHAVQVEETVPDVALQRTRLESAEPDELEEDTDQDESEDESRLRRSKRLKQKSKRLTYPELGNPMISIIQSLLQGLNTAFVESLAEQPRSIRHPKP